MNYLNVNDDDQDCDCEVSEMIIEDSMAREEDEMYNSIGDYNSEEDLPRFDERYHFRCLETGNSKKRYTLHYYEEVTLYY